MITLYSMPSSGNSYKIRLLLAHLGIPFKHIAVEYEGEATLTQTSQFRALNPTGKVPLVVFEDETTLSESNALLHYFGEGTPWVPDERLDRALMYQWMFFEQNMHEGSVAVRMATYNYPQREMDRSPPRMAALLEAGHAALDVMETRLQGHNWLAGQHVSLADLCLYAYTHGARQGGFDLDSRPGISGWLSRVSNLPGHVPLNWLPADA